jgi:oligo-1,6-glucosidase
LNHYADQVGRLGANPADVLVALRRSGRDNARTPMQWTGEAGAGFSTSVPWIPVHPNHVWLNAEAQCGDTTSIYEYYRTLISLRHSEPVIVRGDFALVDVEAETVYAFRRRLGDVTVDVFANLSGESVSVEGAAWGGDKVMIGNYPPARWKAGSLEPWEVRAYRRRSAG